MKKQILTTFISIVLGASTPNWALSAEYQAKIIPKEITSYSVSSQIVSIALASSGESVNAIEGEARVGLSLGDSVEIIKTGSVITLWVEEPAFDLQSRKIKFKGAIASGFSGEKGLLFSVKFAQAKNVPDTEALIAENLTVYKNDGLATSAIVPEAKFSVGDTFDPQDNVKNFLGFDPFQKDDSPPEIFSPSISRDPLAYGGKWFVSFMAVDKQSGISYYEVQENEGEVPEPGKWRRETSPYVLQDQSLRKFVFISAVDREGNERVMKIAPQNTDFNWQKYSWILIIVLITGTIALFFKKKQ